MDRADILDRIRELAASTCPGLTAADIVESATFNTLGLDSVRLVELGVRLEQTFGERVIVDDWIDQEAARGDEGYTVGSLVSFIERSMT